jgi:hypothetical protein
MHRGSPRIGESVRFDARLTGEVASITAAAHPSMPSIAEIEKIKSAIPEAGLY